MPSGLAGRRVDRLVRPVPLGGDEIAVDQQAFLVPHGPETSFSLTERQVAAASDGGFDDRVDGGRAAVGHPRLAPHLDRERHGHERAEQPQQALGVVGQRVQVELLEVRPSPPRAAGTRRRRTPGARPSCWRGAWRSARASVGSAQSANGSRSANSAGRGWACRRLLGSRRGRDPDRRAGLALLVLVDVVAGRSCAGGAAGPPGRSAGTRHGPRLEHRLRRLERVAVLERVLLERDDRELLLRGARRRSSAARSSSVPSKMCVLYDVGQ